MRKPEPACWCSGVWSFSDSRRAQLRSFAASPRTPTPLTPRRDRPGSWRAVIRLLNRCPMRVLPARPWQRAPRRQLRRSVVVALSSSVERERPRGHSVRKRAPRSRARQMPREEPVAYYFSGLGASLSRASRRRERAWAQGPRTSRSDSWRSYSSWAGGRELAALRSRLTLYTRVTPSELGRVERPATGHPWCDLTRSGALVWPSVHSVERSKRLQSERATISSGTREETTLRAQVARVAGSSQILLRRAL